MELYGKRKWIFKKKSVLMNVGKGQCISSFGHSFSQKVSLLGYHLMLTTSSPSFSGKSDYKLCHHFRWPFQSLKVFWVQEYWLHWYFANKTKHHIANTSSHVQKCHRIISSIQTFKNQEILIPIIQIHESLQHGGSLNGCSFRTTATDQTEWVAFLMINAAFDRGRVSV